MATFSMMHSNFPLEAVVRVRHRGLLGLACLLSWLPFMSSPAVAAISLATQDTFATTNDGWQIGAAGVQPTQIAAPGPDGQVGYLSHFSDGSSSNGKWLMWNDGAQWQGNYPTAGVTAITMEANVSSGTSPVSVRVAFGGNGGWFYSDPQSVTSGWNDYSFSLSEPNFTYAAGSGGTGTFSDTMSSVTRFEVFAGAGSVLYRGSNPHLQTGLSTNTVLLDNISAVPEPQGLLWALAGVSMTGALLTRRVKR